MGERVWEGLEEELHQRFGTVGSVSQSQAWLWTYAYGQVYLFICKLLLS